MAPRDVGASRSSQCDWRDSRSPPSPSARIAIPSLFHPPALSLSRHSAHPSSSPSACVFPSLSLLRSISDSSTSIHISSFLSYHIFCLYLSPLALYTLLFHPLRFLRAPLSLSLSFSLILLSYSVFYLHLFLSLCRTLDSPLLALSRASLSIPQQPSRHWPSWSREH